MENTTNSPAPTQPAPAPLDYSKTPNPQTPPAPLQTPGAPTSSQLLPKTHNFPLHKILLIVLIVLAILFVTAYVGVYYLLNQQLDKITKARSGTSPISQAAPTPTIGFPSNTQPTAAPVTTYNPQETNGFPVYPEASFVGKTETPACETTNGYAICGGFAYTWETKDDADQVSAFYKNDPSNSGWKCTGGAGDYTSSRNASGVTQCTNGTETNDLNTTSTQEKTTIILETSTSPIPTVGVACTQEAKACPNGSFVGRTGPNCEFAACPQ